MSILSEVAIDTTDGLAEAIRGGADRIELCSALDLGGLTPSAGVMRQAAGCGVPVFAMIRPRAGHFIWSPDEMAVMASDIAMAREAGLEGVVLGASLPDGRLDLNALATLIEHADGMGLTLHRCFDLVPDPAQAMEQAINLGFHRILTSGCARKAPDGAAVIETLFARAQGRIIIMPGSGVNAESVGALRHLPLQEVHSSCSVAVAGSGKAVDFGFAPPVGQKTDANRVRDLRAALAAG